MPNSVIDNIQRKYEDLFPAEKKVASYILENASEVVNLNVSELADRADTSDATVVRTIKHLGYEGYYQLRLLISKDIGKIEVMSENEDTLTNVQKFLSKEVERINRLSDTIDFEQLIEIGNILLGCNRAHVVAVGNTTPVSTDLGFRLQRSGIKCDYPVLYEQFINNIALGSENDCVIAISRSGASTQVIRAIEMANKKKMTVIVITGELTNAITKNADYVIKLSELKDQMASIYKPDSHLLEFAINDALIYVIQSINKANNVENNEVLKNRDMVGILLSEFKQ